MTTFKTKNQAKRKYYYIAGVLVILLVIVSLAFNSFNNDKSDQNITDGVVNRSGGGPAAHRSEAKIAVKEGPKEYVTIETESGAIRGQKLVFNNKSVNTFLAIPYGKPPIGALRFERTQPIGKWDETRDALQHPASCLQTDSPLVLSAFRFLNATASEDCLYLNIWAPKQEEQFLPVIVYIHGGAFAYGGVATEELDGVALAAQQDVVVVTIQYRLGIFGFMAIDGKEPKGNMGLYDQREALKWIHTNINKFGGDQDLITVVGHGSGAVSAGLHMMTSESKFLFQRTILQGFGLLFNRELYSQTLKFSKKFAEEIDCADAPKLKECIKTINIDRLLEIQQEILEDNPVAFGPLIPSDFVATYPMDTKEAFDFQIDFIFGINSEDDSLFLTTLRNAEEAANDGNGEDSSDNKSERKAKANDKEDETEEKTSDEEEGEESDSESDGNSEVEKEESVPVERPTSKPILTITSTATSSTTNETPIPSTTTTSTTTSTTTTTTTTAAPITTTTPTTTSPTTTTTTTASPTTTTTTTSTTPMSTTTTSEPTTTTEKPLSSSTESSTLEKTTEKEEVEVKEDKEEKEEKDETEKEEKEGSGEEAETEPEGGDEESGDETEEKRRRRKRETDEMSSRVLCPMLRFADQLVDSNRTVYIYELNEFSSHHDEIVFALGYPIRHKNLYDSDEIRYSKRVMKNWAQFATNGDLSETDDQWKSYSKESPQFLKMSISSATLETFNNNNNCKPTVKSQ
ncbi:acetylcholinesterase-1-like [Oppia nitens]|uniref:acetylcholinesterase-1-like n=1 Tax=Oppia nitens TaxID=1686743 RepID=UPI0023D9D619|nr:acetylcholinesterase-1-like [Oppia nitens]